MAEPTAKTVTVKEARAAWSQITEDVLQGARYVVTFHGRPRCAIVPISDLERLQQTAKPTQKVRRAPRK